MAPTSPDEQDRWRAYFQELLRRGGFDGYGGLSDLAQRMGIAQSAITPWKNGTGRPGRASAAKLAAATGVPLQEILDAIQGIERPDPDGGPIGPDSEEYRRLGELLDDPALTPESRSAVEAMLTAARIAGERMLRGDRAS